MRICCVNRRKCLSVSFLKIKCSSICLQVLLFLQKKKEESPPEAQVKEEIGENLKHCGHCQVLNGRNYTDPLSLSLSSFPLTSLSSHFTSPVTLYLPRSLSLSFSFSVLPGYWRVKGMLQSYRLHRLLIPLSAQNKLTCITTGSLRKSLKKSCNNETRILWREYEKRYCLKQLLYSRFHKEGLLLQQSAVDQGEPSVVRVKEICSLGNCLFLSFSSFGVCFGIKVKRKR